jgi:hypothetical protein
MFRRSILPPSLGLKTAPGPETSPWASIASWEPRVS